MPGIDETRAFVPLGIAVLTVSDTRELADDKSGATLAERIEKAGHVLAGRAIVTDDVEKIRAQVRAWIAAPGIDVVITTGGTGLTGRLPRRLGRDPGPPARLPLPPVQFRRAHAAPRRAPAPPQGQSMIPK